MKVTAVCVSREKVAEWALEEEVPLYNLVDSRTAPERGTVARAEFLAGLRNPAVARALEAYPDTTDLLMVDSYYVRQGAVRTLLRDYGDMLQKKRKAILGSSSWYLSYLDLTPRMRFWDSWVTPEATEAKPSMTGIRRVSAVGACYLFPRELWDAGVRYQNAMNYLGSEQVWFCRSSNLPCFMDFNSKVYHGFLGTTNPTKRVFRWIKRQASLGKYFVYPFPRPSIERDGFRWETLSRIDKILGFGQHEKNLRRMVDLTGSSFVDIGANVGGWSIRAARGFKRVYAFEPNPKVARVLRRNARLNKEDNVVCFEAALSSSPGETYLTEYQDLGWSSVVPECLAASASLQTRVLRQRIHVRMETLDRMRESGRLSVDRNSLVKIDAEGAEVEIMKGGMRTLSEIMPRLLIEIHTEENRIACKKILEQLGYLFNELWTPGQTYFVCRRNR